MKPLYKTPPYWAIVGLAALLSAIGIQAEGAAYLPFVFLFALAVVPIGFKRIH